MTSHSHGDHRSLAHDVRFHGWVRLRGSSHAAGLATEIMHLARTLGEPMGGRRDRMVEMLMPMAAERAKANSLSERHGLGAFPFHIDGAHRSRPPRFLILACVDAGASPVPTLLARFHELSLDKVDCQRCATAPFVVRNGRRSFYSTITAEVRPFVRFDPCCMKPLCPDADALAKTIAARSEELGPTAIYWMAGDILILDNWRVLHGRGTGPSVPSRERCILRVAVQ